MSSYDFFVFLNLVHLGFHEPIPSLLQQHEGRHYRVGLGHCFAFTAFQPLHHVIEAQIDWDLFHCESLGASGGR